MGPDGTNVAITAPTEIQYLKRPQDPVSTAHLLARAVHAAVQSAGLTMKDVDGLGVSSATLQPDRAIDLAWHLGLSTRWLMEDLLSLNILHHAVRAIQAGDANVIVVVAGDAMTRANFEVLNKNFNTVTREYKDPLSPGAGANPMFALMTRRHMLRYGLGREAYGAVVQYQRAWAATNSAALYRGPLSIDDYLAAPMVSDPLCLFDCVPLVTGADAVVVLPADDEHAAGGVRIRSVRGSFNWDNQESAWVTTGLSQIVKKLWGESGIDPADLDVVQVYDDYPVMVRAQVADLGLDPDPSCWALPGEQRSTARPAVNTSGGLLTAGQAGAGAMLHGLVEGVRQLQHVRGDGQVPDARTAVVANYGMGLYRYGAVSVASVLERM